MKQCHSLLNKQYAFLCYLALALALDWQLLMCQTDNKNKTFCIQLNYMIMQSVRISKSNKVLAHHFHWHLNSKQLICVTKVNKGNFTSDPLIIWEVTLNFSLFVTCLDFIWCVSHWCVFIWFILFDSMHQVLHYIYS